MTLAEAVDLLECLRDQCADHSIIAADLIEWTEREDITEALAVALNLLKPMAP